MQHIILHTPQHFLRTIEFLKSINHGVLSNILHITILVFQVKTYIRSFDFQSESESLTTENGLPFTDEVIVVLEHK